MLTRTWPILLIVVASWAPSSVQAQVVEEDDTEVLKPVARTKEPAKIPDLAEAAALVVNLTNQLRQEGELETVASDKRLKNAAQDFADSMARSNRYGHKANGTSPPERAQKAGYDFCIVAENIAYAYNSNGFTTEELAQEFVEGWKASPGHRKNMLDPDVVETGVAISQGAKSGYIFAVQLFGRPKSKTLEFKITNESPSKVEYQMGPRTLTLAPGHTRTHQVCRRRDLAFRWSDANGEEETVSPNSGDHFILSRNGDALHLRKE
jgi:uncharacterized protein YkwD